MSTYIVPGTRAEMVVQQPFLNSITFNDMVMELFSLGRWENQCCHTMPEINYLREERLILDHVFRDFSLWFLAPFVLGPWRDRQHITVDLTSIHGPL
jgi:hypothetical protein